MRIKQKGILLSLFIFLYAYAHGAGNYSFMKSGIYYKLSEGYAIVTYGENQYTGAVTIPITVEYNGTNYVVKEIGDDAFSGCTSLSSVSVPYGIERIGNFAFYGCTLLNNVSIPSSVTFIGGSAFNKCNMLTSLVCYATTPPSISSTTFMTNTSIHVPEASYTTYKSKSYWKNLSLIGDIAADAEGNVCEEPSISYNNGTLSFSCTTPNSAIHYSYKINAEGEGTGNTTIVPQIVITAYATAVGARHSNTVTKTFNVIGNSSTLNGDVNNDGEITIADANVILNTFLNK